MNESQQKNLPMSFDDRLRHVQATLRRIPDYSGELYDAKIMSDVALQLYDLRKKSGKTQKELADLLHVKQSNISRWEQPGYQGYKLKALSRLARVLGGRLRITLDDDISYAVIQEKFERSQSIQYREVIIDSDGSKRDTQLSIYHGEKLERTMMQYETV